MVLWKQFLLIGLLAIVGLVGLEGYKTYVLSDKKSMNNAFAAGPVLVETARVTSRVIKRTVEAVGTTRALQSIEIVPESDGRLVELSISPGNLVTAGDVLARLDDSIQRADLSEAEAVLVELRKIVDRVSRLRESNAIPPAAEEAAVARLAGGIAEVERARQRLEERVIRAPFTGIVGLTGFDVGARVEQGQVLTRLDDLSAVEVEFALPETIYAQAIPGQPLQARSAAFPDRIFEGEIVALDTRIDPASRSFKARAVIPNPDSVLPAGMFLSLDLTLSQSEELVVPEEAIVFQAAETFVFVVSEGKAIRRVVTTGQREDGVIAIVSGLSEGEDVVVRGLQRLRDKSPIRVNDTEKSRAVGATPSASGEKS